MTAIDLGPISLQRLSVYRPARNEDAFWGTDEDVDIHFRAGGTGSLVPQRAMLLTSLGEWLAVLLHHVAMPGDRKLSGAGFIDVQWSFELESDGGKTRALWPGGRSNESFDTLDLLERALRAYQTEISRAIAEERITTRLPGQVAIPLSVQMPPGTTPLPHLSSDPPGHSDDTVVFHIRRSNEPKA